MLVLPDIYIQRCFELARLAEGRTSPNPMVGAVLVHGDRIIGEGFHSSYGQAHAEVEAVRSVRADDRQLISEATLYISLEPCSVYGRTPPCTDLILKEKIPKVVISYLDRSPGVNGQGVARLRKYGVEVIEGIRSNDGKWLSAPRNIFVTKQRPYIILKYARSSDGFLGRSNREPVWLTNPYSKRLVHRWRSAIDAIMIGTNTALYDDPQLTTRLYPGPSPIRIVPDRRLRLPRQLHIFDDAIPTLIFTQNNPPDDQYQQTSFIQLEDGDFLPSLLRELHRRNIQTLMIEGGRILLEELLRAGLWDEARLFISPQYLHNGLPAPLPAKAPDQIHRLLEDRLEIYLNH